MKIKKIGIIIGALGVLVIIGFLATRQKNEEYSLSQFNPKDTGIYYEEKAMHEEWGKSTTEIQKGGKVQFNMYQGFEIIKSGSYELSEAELTRILSVAEKSDFLTLRDEYVDPFIMDGGIETLTINYGNKSKTVTVKNNRVEWFDAIVNEINKLTAEKLGEEIFSSK